jgi:hypothetical protein
MLYATIALELSGDQFAAADELLKFKPAWDTFTGALKTAGVKHTAKLDGGEMRAKPGRPVGYRKPRIAAVPPSGEAA